MDFVPLAQPTARPVTRTTFAHHVFRTQASILKTTVSATMGSTPTNKDPASPATQLVSPATADSAPTASHAEQTKSSLATPVSAPPGSQALQVEVVLHATSLVKRATPKASAKSASPTQRLPLLKPPAHATTGSTSLQSDVSSATKLATPVQTETSTVVPLVSAAPRSLMESAPAKTGFTQITPRERVFHVPTDVSRATQALCARLA